MIASARLRLDNASANATVARGSALVTLAQPPWEVHPALGLLVQLPRVALRKFESQ